MNMKSGQKQSHKPNFVLTLGESIISESELSGC